MVHLFQFRRVLLLLTTPALIQPVARIRRGFSGLLGNGLVIFTGRLEESIALAGLRDRNAVAIAESLELIISPGVEDPVVGVDPALLSLVFRFVPGALDLGDEGVPRLVSRFLSLKALLLQIAGELLGVPFLVRLDHIRLPILLHQLFEILPVGRGWIGDVMVGQPPFKLGLLPLVVGYDATSAQIPHAESARLKVPAFENQELATAVLATRASERSVLENFIVDLFARLVNCWKCLCWFEFPLQRWDLRANRHGSGSQAYYGRDVAHRRHYLASRFGRQTMLGLRQELTSHVIAHSKKFYQ